MSDFTKTNTNTQSNNLLFRLPAELRNRIYEEVFSLPKTQYGSTIIRRFSKSYRQRLSVLSLLGTCRLINQEAAKIFFDINSIEIVERYWWDQYSSWSDPTENHQRWKEALRAERFDMVRNITMQIHSPWHANKMLGFLEGMPGLQTIIFAMESRVASCFLSNKDPGIGPRSRSGEQAKADEKFWTKIKTLKHEKELNLRAVICQVNDTGSSVQAFDARLSAL